MLDIDVPDEFLERYRQIPPPRLYRQLLAGDPDQVERVAGAWDVVAGSVQAIATDLATSLEALNHGWAGTGAQAYRERVAVLVAWAQRLADDADAMRTGLTVMAAALTTAQRAAESPPTDDDEVEPSLGLLGPAFGRLMPADVRDRLRERLVHVVATLAVEYAVAEHTVWHGPRPQPASDAEHQPESATTGLASRDGAATPATPHGSGSSASLPVVAPLPAQTQAAAAPPPLSTVAGAGIAQAGGAAPTHLVAPTSIDANSAGPATALPPMLGGTAGSASTTDSGDGRRWRDDATALDPDTIAWSEQDDSPPPPTLGVNAWR
jgi:uncharacterized protein YukE